MVNHKEDFFEDKQGLSSSESYNNSFESSIEAKPSCSNNTSESAARIIKNISEYKELRHFYPLSEKDVDTLNFKANREFSTNFVNQLLLKLYIKYPEKRFKNKFTFLSYMQKALKNEKHQGLLVNHTTFRFSCNINAEEKNLLEYEKYLNEIEHSFDTSKEIQLKKKISGRFSTEIAYKILTQVEFKTNAHNSLITALIPSRLDLSERQIEILSEQLEAVYGINGYYVQDVEEKIPPPKSKTSDIDFNGTPIDILGGSSEIDMTEENTTWHKIRKGLIEELGEAIDTAWFSQAVVKECSTTSTLTLTMPTRFMSDFIKSRYSYAISRIAMVLGVMYIEYNYHR